MHSQLVKNNIRPLGIKPDTGSCSRANINAHAGWDSKRVPTVSAARQQTSHRDILTLLEKKAISKIPPPLGRGFLSRMFVVPKKDGNVRPIIDLRDLNKFVFQEHFKMEGIHLIKDLLREGDWMVKIDLRDAYFSVPRGVGLLQVIDYYIITINNY